MIHVYVRDRVHITAAHVYRDAPSELSCDYHMQIMKHMYYVQHRFSLTHNVTIT